MGRATIKEGAITVAYGWDHATGYFLSVTDERLFDSGDASEEANDIVRKVTKFAGYFDLHTGLVGGFGRAVQVKTMLEFWKRYGVPDVHIQRAQLGQGVPRPEMELDGQACVVCEQPTTLCCSRCRKIYACNAEHAKKGWREHKPQCVSPDASTKASPALPKYPSKVVRGYLLPLNEDSPRLVDVQCEVHTLEKDNQSFDRPINMEKFLGDGNIRRLVLTEAGNPWSQGLTGSRIEILFRKTFPCSGSPISDCVLSITQGQTGLWTVPLLVMKLSDGAQRRYASVDEKALRAATIFLSRYRG